MNKSLQLAYIGSPDFVVPKVLLKLESMYFEDEEKWNTLLEKLEEMQGGNQGHEIEDQWAN